MKVIIFFGSLFWISVSATAEIPVVQLAICPGCVVESAAGEYFESKNVDHIRFISTMKYSGEITGKTDILLTPKPEGYECLSPGECRVTYANPLQIKLADVTDPRESSGVRKQKSDVADVAVTVQGIGIHTDSLCSIRSRGEDEDFSNGMDIYCMFDISDQKALALRVRLTRP